jgi:hypothetical protein
MAGEAWGRGPVILSWADVLDAGKKPGHNVVIHEMAHKLDMLNGDANGFPPLHRRMDRRVWSQVFSSAWDRLKEEQRNGGELPIDPYALESPAEFFAVASEQFFETPATLARAFAGRLSAARAVLPAAPVLSDRVHDGLSTLKTLRRGDGPAGSADAQRQRLVESNSEQSRPKQSPASAKTWR